MITLIFSDWPGDLLVILIFFFFLRFCCCGSFLKSLLNLLQYCFCFMFWCFGHQARRILAPPPGMEPTRPALKSGVSTTDHQGSPCMYFQNLCFYLTLCLSMSVNMLHETSFLLSHYFKAEMATHRSILAWKITWMEEPGGQNPMGPQRVRQVRVTDTHKAGPLRPL